MQNSSTILGIVEMRLKGISYDDCRHWFGVGNSTVTFIMERYYACGIPLKSLQARPASEVEAIFYLPGNIRRKSEDIMPDFDAIHSRIVKNGSKDNVYYLWLKYKQAHPSGYQYTQFCYYYNKYLDTHNVAREIRMSVERIPGERAYIDWVGDQPGLLVNPKKGELEKAHS